MKQSFWTPFQTKEIPPKRDACFYMCVCGVKKWVDKYSVRSMASVSCGCKKKKANGMTSGETRATWKIWNSMINRCENPKSKDSIYYHHRGIRVCKRWFVFENFLEDMGIRPEKLTLERVKNELGYSKENCCWATRKQQSRNTTLNVWFEINGAMIKRVDLLDKSKVKLSTFRMRIKNGWNPLDAAEITEEQLTKK